MINARIMFSDIQALDISGVTSLSEDTGLSSVAIDDAVFAPLRSYKQLGAGAGTENTLAHRMYTGGDGCDEEDIMLQYAIRLCGCDQECGQEMSDAGTWQSQGKKSQDKKEKLGIEGYPTHNELKSSTIMFRDPLST